MQVLEGPRSLLTAPSQRAPLRLEVKASFGQISPKPDKPQQTQKVPSKCLCLDTGGIENTMAKNHKVLLVGAG